MTNTKGSIPSKARLRGLKQFAGWTGDEFEKYWETKVTGYIGGAEFQNRISKKLDEFSEDYDLSDLKANDKLVL